MNKIQKQIQLPLSVAVEVVLQGIRIRLGRALVTLMGIVLGIAFLMSILTGQSIRRGISIETETRAEMSRMQNFLEAETGPVAGRTLGIVQVGTLNPLEVRFVDHLRRQDVESFRWVAGSGMPMPAGIPKTMVHATGLSEVGRDASGIVVLGDGDMPVADWDALLASARQPVVALFRKQYDAALGPSTTVVQLERERHLDELAAREKEARSNRFRTNWIIVISLLVTVIGITNAMLMSVTERFREIGTMKCLGALSAFVRQIFFIESSLLGAVGSMVGALFGGLFSILAFGATYGLVLVLGALSPVTLLLYVAFCLVAGMALSIMAAIYPASVASRMLPATALRSTI